MVRKPFISAANNNFIVVLLLSIVAYHQVSTTGVEARDLKIDTNFDDGNEDAGLLVVLK